MSVANLYIATHSWSSPIRVGSHHIAAHLTRQKKLLYISHPVSLPSLFTPSNNNLKSRLQLAFNGPSDKHTPAGMYEANAIMPFSPGPKWPFSSRLCVNHGFKLAFPAPQTQLDKAEIDHVSDLWVDSMFQSHWPNLVAHDRLLVRVADHPEHMTNRSKHVLKALFAMVQQADLTITPNTVTAEYLQKHCDVQVEVVANGVDVGHFSQPTPLPIEYSNDPKPKVIFVGALAHWIDIRLLKATAERCNEYSFYVVGPNHGMKLKELPQNLKILGGRPYSTIPSYLKHAQIAIAPFDVDHQNQFIESIDAIKLYEYVAAGLPVLATKWRQSKSLAPYVVTTNQNSKDFAAALHEIMAQRQSHIASQSFVNELDWSNRLKALAI